MFGPPSRREFLAVPARRLAAALMAGVGGRSLASQDDQLLDDLSRRCFLYFWEQSDTHSGIARDRARADGGLHTSEGRYVGRTAATVPTCRQPHDISRKILRGPASPPGFMNE